MTAIAASRTPRSLGAATEVAHVVERDDRRDSVVEREARDTAGREAAREILRRTARAVDMQYRKDRVQRPRVRDDRDAVDVLLREIGKERFNAHADLLVRFTGLRGVGRGRLW